EEARREADAAHAAAAAGQAEAAPVRPEALAAAALATSSAAFERYRASLRAGNGALLKQFRTLVACERGLSGADHCLGALGLGRCGAAVEALLQLADLWLEQQGAAAAGPEGGRGSPGPAGPPEGLEAAACELFEELCAAVAELPEAAPGLQCASPELYADALRERWSGRGVIASDGGGRGERWAARAAALFRMKDTISSTYAWALLPRGALERLLRAAVEGEGGRAVPRAVDPMAGTGLHGLLLRAAGAEVALADAVSGGDTQAAGAGPHPRGISLGAAALGPGEAAVLTPGIVPLLWQPVERVDVLDDGEEAAAWWRRHCCSGPGTLVVPILFLSFPPPPPSTVAEAALRRFVGDWVLFVGEWRGCTGSAAFFDALDAGWDIAREEVLPRWPMMDDKAVLLRRRPAAHSAPHAHAPGAPLRVSHSPSDKLEVADVWLVDEERGISLRVLAKAGDGGGGGATPTTDGAVAPGETGAVLWGASRVLVDYLRRVDTRILGRAESIVELGAGCFGLVGAYLRHRLRSSKIVHTDLPHVIPRLHE
ncbi:unnamed protein product, partial [Prorocentrum cordatum]